MHAYKHLRQLCREIKTEMGDRLADDDVDGSSYSDESGSLNDAMIELRDTIHSAIQQANQVNICFTVNVYKK